MFNLRKSQVGKRDLSPLLSLTPGCVNRKRRSGDKSLLPICDFLMSGELVHLAASQEKNQNGQTPGSFRSLLAALRSHLTRLVAKIAVLALCAAAVVAQSNAYGPEVRGFLSFLRQEESELEFQIARKEISRGEFTRSKNRIAIQRGAVLKFVRETGEDRVPDYNVVAPSEANQLLEDGAKLLKTAKPGDVLGGKWRLIGRETRGELFYVLERVSANVRSPGMARE